eukprot:1743932-Rhodomonas_salina.2
MRAGQRFAGSGGTNCRSSGTVQYTDVVRGWAAKYVLKAEQEYQAEAVEPMVVAIVEACCNHAKGVAP